MGKIADQQKFNLFSQLNTYYAQIFQPLRTDVDFIDNLLGQEPLPSQPAYDLIFKTFSSTPLKPKAIIIGQDPYPNPNHACGLAFSVPSTISFDELPPTLKNIFLELSRDCVLPMPNKGDLSNWVTQGVLLFNPRLTLNKENKVLNKAWDELANKILKTLLQANPDLVIIAWGNKALKHVEGLNPKHLISSPHPSPLSVYRGFKNSAPFSRTNTILHSINQKPIDWRLP